jgi:hypothetical protein
MALTGTHADGEHGNIADDNLRDIAIAELRAFAAAGAVVATMVDNGDASVTITTAT